MYILSESIAGCYTEGHTLLNGLKNLSQTIGYRLQDIQVRSGHLLHHLELDHCECTSTVPRVPILAIKIYKTSFDYALLILQTCIIFAGVTLSLVHESLTT